MLDEKDRFEVNNAEHNYEKLHARDEAAYINVRILSSLSFPFLPFPSLPYFLRFLSANAGSFLERAIRGPQAS